MPDLTRRIPASLEPLAEWHRFESANGAIPTLLVHPDQARGYPAPLVIWLHGRTVSKELDPGRYLRWARGGIGTCAIDLPGHGERFDMSLQPAAAAWDVLTQTVMEIDQVCDALRTGFHDFDLSRAAIGGMSLGGMAALARLTREHPFVCASVEATSGSWAAQRDREMFRDRVHEVTQRFEPIENLDSWREIPIQAIHACGDEWVKFEGQQQFIEALRTTYENPNLIDFVVYERTGAPHEHIGFGKHAVDAKIRQMGFFRKYLLSPFRDARLRA